MEKSGLNEKQWAMLCHAGGLAGYIIPFGNIIVPAIIWTSKKDQSEWIDDQGKESLNFQISLTIYVIISFILMFVVIGIFLLIALGIGGLVFVILAIIKTDQGERYRYPFTIRFIT